MQAKAYASHRQYFVFRFEDSLRKYQPLPHKRVKLSHQNCQHCLKKHNQFSKQSRVSRLCATRKKYHLESRQQASGYSHRKQAKQQNSIDRSRGLVSDFMCDNNVQIEIKQDNMNESNQEEKQQNKKQKEVVDFVIKNTPIKEEVRAGMREREGEVKEELQMSYEKKVLRIRDIDFHIGLVSQLHQELCDKYKETPLVDNEKEEVNQIQVENNYKIIDQFRMQQENQQNESQKNLQEKRQQIQLQVQQYLEQQEQDNDKNQQTVNKKSPQRLMQRQKFMQFSKNKNKRLKQFIMHERYNERQQSNDGRIKFTGKKGDCWLSARVLSKLCKNYGSPQKITIRLLERHPYLENINKQISQKLETTENISKKQ